MGAGRTTTGTVIGGLLAMYGTGNPSAVLSYGGLSSGGSFALPPTAVGVGAGAVGGSAGGGGGSALPPTAPRPAPIATGGAGGMQGQGLGGGSGTGRSAEGLVAGLNEDQSRDILREEIGGDSPRCSGGCVRHGRPFQHAVALMHLSGAPGMPGSAAWLSIFLALQRSFACNLALWLCYAWHHRCKALGTREGGCYKWILSPLVCSLHTSCNYVHVTVTVTATAPLLSCR